MEEFTLSSKSEGKYNEKGSITTASGTGDQSHTFSWSYTTDSYYGRFYIDRIEIIWDDE